MKAIGLKRILAPQRVGEERRCEVEERALDRVKQVGARIAVYSESECRKPSLKSDIGGRRGQPVVARCAQSNGTIPGQQPGACRKLPAQLVQKISHKYLSFLLERQLASCIAGGASGAVEVIVDVSAEAYCRDVIGILFETKFSSQTPSRLPFSVIRTAVPMVAGWDTLPDFRSGKIYPPASTTPEPIAGPEIGRGVATIDPRFSFLVP
jgi:hypothetical protein